MKDCGVYLSGMAAVNTHRCGAGFTGTMINDDLEECDSDFTTHWDDPMEGGSSSIISNLELLKQAVLIDASKNCDDNDYYEKWDRHIYCKSTLFAQLFPNETPAPRLVKVKCLWNFEGFVLRLI